MAVNDDLHDRLQRVEDSLFRFREEMHHDHIELLNKIQDIQTSHVTEIASTKQFCMAEVNKVNSIVERHSSYWATTLGFTGFIGTGLVAWFQGWFGKH